MHARPLTAAHRRRLARLAIAVAEGIDTRHNGPDWAEFTELFDGLVAEVEERRHQRALEAEGWGVDR